MRDIQIDHQPLTRGDCFKIARRFVDRVTGNPLDLSGYRVRVAVCTVKNNQLLAEVTDAAELVIDAPAGTVQGEVANGDATAAWPLEKIFYDIALIDPDDCPRTINRGNVLLRKSASGGTP